jgi:hypothetical protein
MAMLHNTLSIAPPPCGQMGGEATSLVSTSAAASILGLKRPQFLAVARYLGLKPVRQQKLTAKSRTPANVYSADELALLKALEAHCQVSGPHVVLKHLLDAQ